jgi:hypothetical protein
MAKQKPEVQDQVEVGPGKEDFRSRAKPVEVVIGGSRFMAMPKVFKTGSIGWYLNAKTVLDDADGKPQPVQIGLNLTVVGSKKE